MSEFFGEQFEAPEKINTRRLTRLARAARTSGEDALADIDALVDTCLRKEDVERFDALCDEHCPDLDALSAFCAAQLEEVAGRPTSRSSDSSAGPSSTATSSMDVSSSRVVELLPGRPDLQVLVENSQQGRATG